MIKTPSSTVIGGAGIWTPNTMIVGSTNQNLSSLIKSLFQNGEQGFAYDPNDLSTMFRDSAGTVPVTGVGQPVGLILDKSKGLALGGEKSAYATGFTSLTGITNIGTTSAISNTDLIVTAISTDGNDRVEIPISDLVVGKRYLVEFVVKGNLINDQVVYSWTVGVVPVTPVKNTDYAKYTFSFIATAVSGVARFYAGAGVGASGGILYVKSMSIKEILGSHASQATSSMRPPLQDAPRRIQYDGADDKLTTTLPSQLTGCTVIRAVPNVGTQILTNQTIPTPYNDSTDHCGLIVINRALTSAEISQITKLFNKAAGV